MKDTIG